MKHIRFLYMFPNCYGQMEGLCARRAAPHVQNTPKKHQKLRLQGIEKRAKCNKKSYFFYTFCDILLTHFCCFLCDFLTILGPLFDDFWATVWSSFRTLFLDLRARGHFASREPREQANFGSRVRTHLLGHVWHVVSSFWGSFLYRFSVVFWAHVCSFFVILCRLLSLFCLCVFATFSYFWAVFCMRFGTWLFSVFRQIFA